MGSVFSSTTSYECPDYGVRCFNRDIADCKIHIAILVQEQAKDAKGNKYASTRRLLESCVRGIPPSFRKTPEYEAVADEMLRTLKITPPDPILYTIIPN